MIKLSHYQGYSEEVGASVIPLFNRNTDSVLEKVAAPNLLPGVLEYIDTLKPQEHSQYVLVNAMAAGEYFGANINSDYFSEASLTHCPKEWSDNPKFDIELAKTWPYGFPTFYTGHPYAHHRNKDSTRAFGSIEYAGWNDRMKRVELVTRVDEDKCYKFGGEQVWVRLSNGDFVDVSMGTKVPFDLCSICTDWALYREAEKTFDPARHKHPGEAILQFHKMLIAKYGHGIRGLSPTRATYCEHMKKLPGKLLPDGRKVFVYNPHPRFFDISFVFIGADRTAKVMLKVAHGNRVYSIPSAKVAELVYVPNIESLIVDPTPSIKEAAVQKKALIVKRVIPNQLGAKAVPILSKQDKEMPNSLLNTLGAKGLKPSLEAATALGMVLRPQEFQRVFLTDAGMKSTADKLENSGILFPKVQESAQLGLSGEKVSPLLVKLLSPFLGERSAFEPHITRRIIVISTSRPGASKQITSQDTPLLRSIGAAYNGYRKALLEILPETQKAIAQESMGDIAKMASVPLEDLFTPMSYQYLKDAFWDDVR